MNLPSCPGRAMSTPALPAIETSTIWRSTIWTGLGEGDYLYLLYDGLVFQYLFRDFLIVSPENWDVIRPQGYPCLTLTTCDPIGTTISRLVVHGELVDWEEYSEAYNFVSNGSY